MEAFFVVGGSICMKKVLISQKAIISMYDYLVHYGQMEEKIAPRYCNYPHERMKNVIHGMPIVRLPIRYYQDEYALRGMVLWVCDRSGKKLPYINPLLLNTISKQGVIAGLMMGRDNELLDYILRETEVVGIPVDKTPSFSGYTFKKSYQKIIDKKRKEWLE